MPSAHAHFVFWHGEVLLPTDCHPLAQLDHASPERNFLSSGLRKIVRHNDIQGENCVHQNQILCVIYAQMCIIGNTALLSEVLQFFFFLNNASVGLNTVINNIHFFTFLLAINADCTNVFTLQLQDPVKRPYPHPLPLPMLI